MKSNRTPVLYAILAAFCYGISTPVSKLLLAQVPAAFMAAMLYLGAGIGMAVVYACGPKSVKKEAKISRRELPYTIAMVVLDIAAPIFLMAGLAQINPATASLLNNFEIVATALIALVFFKEAVGKRLWLAIAFVTAASAMLSVEDIATFRLSKGAIFVLLACLCWGVENNCTRMLSLKSPLQIVIIKGFGSGLGALLIALSLGQYTYSAAHICIALLLGFVAYGLSIYFYILAQRELGAARTSAYYAFAPFIGVGLSLLVFWERPKITFWIACILMMAGAYLAAFEKHDHVHIHPAQSHEHRHNHDDGHHTHTHEPPVTGEHSHVHDHAALEHGLNTRRIYTTRIHIDFLPVQPNAK